MPQAHDQKKQVQPSGDALVTTDYVNGFQYVDNALKFFPHTEGYVEFENNQYLYTYQYKDHLGNVRLTYRDGFRNHPTLEYAKDGIIQVSEIIEKSDYYPFGLKQKGDDLPDYSIVNKYKYAYGGKELNDELGLDLYDFGARNYDAAIGRWLNVDPLAENSRRWTPYNYACNNPIYFVDPDGMQAVSNSQLNDLDDIIKINVDTGNVDIETKAGDDIVQFVDNKGTIKDEYKYGDNGSFKKDFQHTETKKGDIPINELKTNNFKKGDKLFDKIAQNSNIEWEYMTISQNGQYISTAMGNTGRYFNDGLSVGYAAHYFFNDMSNIYSNIGMKISSHEHNHPKFKNGLIADWPSSYHKKSRLVNQDAKKGDGVFARDLKENTKIVDPKINFFIRPKGANYKVKYDGVYPYTHVK
ncbi:RHS repeat domain-containing protein [Paenimyroides aestuarii]|uniref:RHS repeat-associated core domain-containing protein n=1 Tax=Paenimyroides aestuarii TaxID=2968490 RepID=A0ABY5NTU9_9FLAO|nr:RHS repeat-associated core domain-containing protein [Paenimyroides aestuarii]UUV22013.1 RHS repeat-associated core domain-containing protein [Paenimyroides aestuarii]